MKLLISHFLPGFPFSYRLACKRNHHTKSKFLLRRENKALQKSNVLFIKQTRKNIKAAFSFH